MLLEGFCATMIAFVLGLFICFGGYRLFLILLPIWGFFFGFVLGAETLQIIFGEAFLATVTSWVVGFVVGAIFGVLSYLFYAVAVALIAGALGYLVGIAFMDLIGVDWGFLMWAVGIVVAVAAVVATFYFNLQKWAIIIATAVGGAGLCVGTLFTGLGGVAIAKYLESPIRLILDNRPLLAILFLVLVAAGVFVQYRASRAWTLEPYDNRI